jgi:hypothetical protein
MAAMGGKTKIRDFVCPTCKQSFQRHVKTAKFCSHSCHMVWRMNPSHERRTPEEKQEIKRRYANDKWHKMRGDPEWRKLKRQATNKHNKKIRLAALMAYGGLSCSCDHHGKPCGQKPIEFLALDHVGGNGKIPGEGGLPLCRKLRKLGYPSGYRVLCHNCNSSLGHYGRCPLSDTEVQQRWKTSPGNKKIRAQNQLCK